ncbi:MAG: glucosaminidase domain-containing protein [Flavobacteriales bacterium]|nr:glucosaminidase domain-containing protein [Flavobacteriales bacterium]
MTIPLKTSTAAVLMLLAGAAFGQRYTAEEYIAQWEGVAVKAMKEHGIPASITLAQGLLESGNGNSELAREARNHFGIKCTPDWTGGKSYHDDDRKNDCFRKYNDAADSYDDHARFLQRPRYAGLFELRTTDYKGWAHGLKKAGYATDPRYPQKLIDLIERYELHKLDSGGKPSRPAPAPKPSTTKPRPTEGDEVIVSVDGSRPIQRNALGMKVVMARRGDTFRGVADELGVLAGQVAKWNDQDKNAAIMEGQVLYLQPKRNQAKEAKEHVVRAGESLWSISQEHGMKLEKLALYNGLAEDAPVAPGTRLVLRKPKR